jgi:hypothetical protein
MGQYFKVVCHTKRDAGALQVNGKMEWLSPTTARQASELMSHAFIENPFMNVVMNLLEKGKVFYRKQLVWIGERAEDVDPVPGISPTLYRDVQDVTRFYQRENFGDNLPQYNDNLRWIVNWTKLECVDLHKLVEFGNDQVIHPLGILCAYGNGDNSGDYPNGDNDPLVGSWAGDIISAEPLKTTETFTEIFPKFTIEQIIGLPF